MLAVASLATSWFSVTMNSDDNTVKAAFTAYLYQVQGTVNGTSASTFPNLWFAYAALAVMVIVAAGCFAGGFIAGRRGSVLLLTAGILSLVAMVVFGVGLLTGNYGDIAKEPGLAMRLFPSNAFTITADDAMLSWGYSMSWIFSYGFWLALGAAIMACVGAIAPALTQKKTVPPAIST